MVLGVLLAADLEEAWAEPAVASAEWAAEVAVVAKPSVFARHARRGMVLIIVLIVIMFLALGAYSFTDLMLTHQESAQLTGRQIQTRFLVESGMEATRLFLSQSKTARLEAGGIFDNPTRFKGLTIVPEDDPKERASVAIISPNLSDEGTLSGLRLWSGRRVHSPEFEHAARA